MLGTFDVTVTSGAVESVKETDRYTFWANWEGEARMFLEALTRYLILTGAGGTLTRLVALGLPVKDVEPLIHCDRFSCFVATVSSRLVGGFFSYGCESP
jgi:hypothetical protein